MDPDVIIVEDDITPQQASGATSASAQTGGNPTSAQARPSSAQRQQQLQQKQQQGRADQSKAAQAQQQQQQQRKTSPPRDIPLEHLEKAVENACNTLYSLSTNVMDFSYDSQHVLYSTVNEFVRDLRAIDHCASKVDATIPADVIEAIDKGRNPEWCTYETLESCAEASNLLRGKLDIVKPFGDELEKALREAQAEGNLLVKDADADKSDGAGDVLGARTDDSAATHDNPSARKNNGSNGF